MVLVLKIIAILAAGVLVTLALLGIRALRAQSLATKRLSSELRCPSCGSLYSPVALKTARTKVENPVREIIEEGLRKLGVRMRTARTWDIICTSCGKTSHYDPVGKAFKTKK